MHSKLWASLNPCCGSILALAGQPGPVCYGQACCSFGDKVVFHGTIIIWQAQAEQLAVENF